MSGLKLQEKSFLEPKLLESLNLSFRVQADLNMYFDNGSTPKNQVAVSNTLAKRKASVAVNLKRSTYLLKQIVHETRIWIVVQQFIH